MDNVCEALDTCSIEEASPRKLAEKTADEWMPFVREALVQAILDPKQHRDIGKMLAQATEMHVNQWLCQHTGRSIKGISGKAYDGETTDEQHPKVRHQTKFRAKVIHLETTRRHSVKNIEANSSGHVVYRSNEFDALVVFKPSPIFGITGSSIKVFPVNALIDPNNPTLLVKRISKVIEKEHENVNACLKSIYGETTSSNTSLP